MSFKKGGLSQKQRKRRARRRQRVEELVVILCSQGHENSLMKASKVLDTFETVVPPGGTLIVHDVECSICNELVREREAAKAAEKAGEKKEIDHILHLFRPGETFVTIPRVEFLLDEERLRASFHALTVHVDVETQLVYFELLSRKGVDFDNVEELVDASSYEGHLRRGRHPDDEDVDIFYVCFRFSSLRQKSTRPLYLGKKCNPKRRVCQRDYCPHHNLRPVEELDFWNFSWRERRSE